MIKHGKWHTQTKMEDKSISIFLYNEYISGTNNKQNC
jgi:hypothetical protein